MKIRKKEGGKERRKGGKKERRSKGKKESKKKKGDVKALKTFNKNSIINHANQAEWWKAFDRVFRGFETAWRQQMNKACHRGQILYVKQKSMYMKA